MGRTRIDARRVRQPKNDEDEYELWNVAENRDEFRNDLRY